MLILFLHKKRSRDMCYDSGSNPKKLLHSKGWKRREIESRKNCEIQSSVKILCSVHKTSTDFQAKIAFCFFRDRKNHPQNCGIRFLKVHQANWCFISKTRGYLLDSFERMSSKLTFGLRFHDLAAFFFLKSRRYYRKRFLAKNCRSSNISKNVQPTIRAHHRILEW